MGRPKGSKNKPKTAKGNQDKTSTKARPALNYELRLRKPMKQMENLIKMKKKLHKKLKQY